MQNKVLALLTVVFWCLADYAYGQEVNKFNLGLGVASASGQSKIDRISPIYSAPVFIINAGITGGDLRLMGRYKNGPHKFGGSSLDLSIENKAGSMGPTKIILGFQYFSAEDKDVVQDYDNLFVTGNTKKKYAFIGFGIRAGDYHKKNIKGQVMLGATSMHKYLHSFTEGREFEGSPTLVNRDFLPAIMLGGTFSWPNLWKHISIEASVRNIRTPRTKMFDRKNTREIVPINQTGAEINIQRPLNSWLGISLTGIWSSHDTGMVFLGNSVSTASTLRW